MDCQGSAGSESGIRTLMRDKPLWNLLDPDILALHIPVL
jgi:hypothetical protein